MPAKSPAPVKSAKAASAPAKNKNKVAPSRPAASKSPQSGRKAASKPAAESRSTEMMTASRGHQGEDMAPTPATISGGGEAAELSDDEDFDGTEPEVMQGERNLGEFSSGDDDDSY